jgi:hypothetical protein
MLRRRLAIPFLLLLAALGIGAVVYAQLESSDRGILPLDTSGTLEIGPVHVDVSAADSQSARLAGWRMAQRQGFRALWAKMHNAPINQAPNPPDGALDQIVSSINVDHELLGPNRYIADLTIEFDRNRSAPFLGVEGSQVTEHSVPMLLIPVTVTAGTETSVEFRNAWQRAWAQFRTAQTPINYVRVSGMGADPLLVNAAQIGRPGRGWWWRFSTCTARRTSSSRKFSFNAPTRAARPSRVSLRAMAQTMRSLAGSRSPRPTAMRSRR